MKRTTVEMTQIMTHPLTHSKMKSISIKTVKTRVKFKAKKALSCFRTSSKYKNPTYSRYSRKLRQLEHSGNAQSNKISRYINLEKSIANIEKRITKTNLNVIKNKFRATFIPKSLHEDLNFSKFLKDLLVMCEKQSLTVKSRYRYKETIKLFSLYLYLIAGRKTYLLLQSNLPIPSLSLVRKHFAKTGPPIKEGHLRVDELKQYLLKNNYPLTVFLSEDATGIVKRVEYSSNYNLISGLVLPLGTNGIPISDSFLANKFENILNYIKNNNRASLVYVILAQPLEPGASPFCLAAFGIDNTFTADDILNRWKFTIDQLENNSIQVIGISSDGDTRLLKAMRIQTKLFTNTNNEHVNFFIAENKTIAFVQDTVHILTKLRTRFLKSDEKKLKIGKYSINIAHIRYLLKAFPKCQHLLVESDLNLADKMNFESARKLCDQKVLELLKKDSDKGTLAYLKIMNAIYSSYLTSISIKERIFKIWYAVFMLRIWRASIQKGNLKEFISSNSYMCIELNAHALIVILEIFEKRKINSQHFLPEMFSSQPCESFFRAARSMTSTFSTVVNFSINEFLNRVKRIEQLVSIKNSDVLSEYTFVKNSKCWNSNSQQYNDVSNRLLDENEIQLSIEDARIQAEIDSRELGVKVLPEYFYGNLPDLYAPSITSKDSYKKQKKKPKKH